MENKKGSEVFLGVIGVATLLVAIIGATFAYFSTTLTGETRTLATAAILELGFVDDITGIKTNLIPAETNIARYSVENATHVSSKGQCKDDNLNDICGVYDFTIGNPSFTTSQKIYGTMNVVTNDLPDLMFMVYLVERTSSEVDGETVVTETLTPVIDPTDVPDAEDSIALTALNQTLLPSSSDDANKDGEADKQTFLSTDPKTYTPVTGTDDTGKAAYNTRTYRMLVWINETGENQTEDHKGKSFSAGITFTSGTSKENGVTGVIAAAKSNEPASTSAPSTEPEDNG